jgi:hypothetical protein
MNQPIQVFKALNLKKIDWLASHELKIMLVLKKSYNTGARRQAAGFEWFF